MDPNSSDALLRRREATLLTWRGPVGFTEQMTYNGYLVARLQVLAGMMGCMPWLALSTGLFVVAISARAPAQQRPDTSRRRKVVLPSQISYDTSGRLYGSQRVPRSIGASMGVIDSATLAAPIARTLSELLAARVAGVSVLRSSGVVGTGSRVRLRGASGLFAPREPIVILDGVRIDATQNTPGLSLGGQQPSRLDDIDVEQVARIEILRGPATSALYGTDARVGHPNHHANTESGKPGVDDVRRRRHLERRHAISCQLFNGVRRYRPRHVPAR